MKDSYIIDVFESTIQIGSLYRYGTDTYSFVYHDDYIARGGHELCMTMPVTNKPYVSKMLHPFFTNYISEGWLGSIQKRMVEPKISPRTKTADVMVAFGSCFGALRFIRHSKGVASKSSTHVQDSNAEYCLLEPQIGEAEKAMIPGAQPKVLAVRSPDKKSYLLANENQPSTHIAKLPLKKTFPHILENELCATHIVKALLPEDDICELELSSLEGVDGHALTIKRFDRLEDGTCVPFYEFNQLLGRNSEDKYDGSYGEMADYIYERSVEGGKNGVFCKLKDARKLFSRILADIIIGNTDAHLKNFALKKVKGQFTLTPNYDLVSSAMYGKKGKNSFGQVALELGGTKVYNIGDVDAKRLILLAYEFQITPSELISDINYLRDNLEQAEKTIDSLDAVSLKIKKYFKKTIRKRWNGAFASVERLIKTNPPRNIFKHKKTRQIAERSLSFSLHLPAIDTNQITIIAQP